jgi:hypothetical protein
MRVLTFSTPYTRTHVVEITGGWFVTYYVSETGMTSTIVSDVSKILDPMCFNMWNGELKAAPE